MKKTITLALLAISSSMYAEEKATVKAGPTMQPSRMGPPMLRPEQQDSRATYINMKELQFGNVTLNPSDLSFTVSEDQLSIPLNDGLSYNVQMSSAITQSVFGYIPTVHALSMHKDVFIFTDIDGSSVTFARLNTHANLFRSKEGYYAYATGTSGFGTMTVAVYRPDGSHLTFYPFEPNMVRWEVFHGTAKKVYSAHNLDSYTYAGRYNCSMTLSTGYQQSCQSRFNYAVNITVNNWVKINNGFGQWTINNYTTEYPDGSSSYFLTKHKYQNPLGLEVSVFNSGNNHYTEKSHAKFTFKNIENLFSIDMQADTSLIYKRGQNFKVRVDLPNGDYIDYHFKRWQKNDNRFPTFEATQTRGQYLYKKIYDKNDRLLYSETNTFSNVNGIETVTKTDFYQDGVTFSIEYQSYDTYNNPTKVVETASNGDKRTTTITYHKTGSPSLTGSVFLIQPATITKTDKDGKILYKEENVYNAQGFKTKSTVNGIITHYTYDEKGNLKTKKDALGNQIQYLDYWGGQPQKVIDPEGNVTQYTYDKRGLKLSQTDPKGNVTRWTYDSMGRMTSMTPPIGLATRYTYKDGGRTVEATKGSLKITSTSDGFGRQLSTVREGFSATSYKYDDLNNRSFVSYPCATLSQCTIGRVTTKDALDRDVRLVTNTEGF